MLPHIMVLQKQIALAISTTEAEYVSVGKACQQALWMKQALVDYDIVLDDIPILCDNKRAIGLSKNIILHSRTKHIKIRYHFLRDNVQKGNISIEKVASEDNIADILTKHLKREPFNLFRLGVFKEDVEYQSCGRLLQHKLELSSCFPPESVVYLDLTRLEMLTKLFDIPQLFLYPGSLASCTCLVLIESCKLPIAELFDIDSGRISICHCEILKSVTLNVLARSQG
ncbi:hypothetical protein Tco_1203676 [Tanacetum coccineum]